MTLDTLALILSVALASPARASGGSAPLPAPENVVASVSCGALDASWDAVPGAGGYAVEITLVYEPVSADCAAGSGTEYVLRFTQDAANLSISAASLVFDLGAGMRAPCRVPLMRVRAVGTPGGGDNPAASAVPVPSCAAPLLRPLPARA